MIRIATLLAAAAVCAYASLGLAALAPAHRVGSVVKTNRVTLHLPKRGKTLATKSSTRIPAGLNGYYGYVQLVAANGAKSPKAAIGRPLVFKDQNGKRLFSLKMVTAYNRQAGRLVVGLKLRNIGVRSRKARRQKIFALVTVGWRR